MCEQARATSHALHGARQFLAITFYPLFFLFVVKQGDLDLTVPTFLGIFLVHPIAIVAHELGHALVGKLLGLEIAAMTIGAGRLIWRFEIGSMPVHVHAWPLSGLVNLGAASKTLLRTRIWLTTAAGPLTNAALMVAGAVWQSTLEGFLGSTLSAMWLIANLMLFLSAILPQRPAPSPSAATRVHRSDGQQLWQLPRASAEIMDLYLTSTLLTRSVSLFNAHDYARGKAAAERLLERAPDNRVARLMISANTSNLGEHERTLEVLTPLLQSIDTLDAPTRAAVCNNMAFALIMSCRASCAEAGPLQQAEELSANAFSAYPCALAYRSTRALVLTAVGRPSEALTLLQYMHYESASAVERGHREGVRAFALHRLGRAQEAQLAARVSLELNPTMRNILEALMPEDVVERPLQDGSRRFRSQHLHQPHDGEHGAWQRGERRPFSPDQTGE